ncbi:phosphotransferase enzyme family protein [Microlunatus kandeliicorticis]|uniref:phosphotransferase enzyme family protein n=1 Tax=Microlunatus kandeliicorticis TaxID=1759536 RepID=UPI001C71A18D|nr:phosphotransferase [Microlunatus kandeliicorticis]
MTETVRRAYGWSPAAIEQIHAGTATDNFALTDGAGRRWFAKVYREADRLPLEEAAIGLAGCARDGGVPVPAQHPDLQGRTFGRSGPLVLSLWDFVEGAETAEGGLRGPRWAAVGSVLGRLHRRLAGHPAGPPVLRPAVELRDGSGARRRYDRLIDAYRTRRKLSDFEAWALEAAVQRRAMLPRVEAILRGLPALTTQIVHGDLASPNLLLRGDEIAAVIDFQPPAARFAAWEIARIGCDPRTVLGTPTWDAELGRLIDAYREENPRLPEADLAAVVAVGCAFTLSSIYPLAVPLEHPQELDESLTTYARARHEAALQMLDAIGG